MRSSGSASWSSDWTSLTSTGAFEPLYSCCYHHYSWPWRQSHNGISPIQSPEGDSSTAAHSRWFQRSSGRKMRKNADRRVVICVQVLLEIQMISLVTSQPTHEHAQGCSALPGCAAKTHANRVFPPVCRLHRTKQSKFNQILEKRCWTNQTHLWFAVFSLFFFIFKAQLYTVTNAIYWNYIRVFFTRLCHSDLGVSFLAIWSIVCHEMICCELILNSFDTIHSWCRFFKIQC